LLATGVFLRIENEQRSQERKERGAKNDSDGAKESDSAENSEKQKQHGNAEPVADQERLKNIVNHPDDA
jgi:hypothetical protein